MICFRTTNGTMVARSFNPFPTTTVDIRTPEQKLADFYHELSCKCYHPDDCNWYREDWTSDNIKRRDILKRVSYFLSLIDGDEALAQNMIVALFR